jgi:hypothetical protein
VTRPFSSFVKLSCLVLTNRLAIADVFKVENPSSLANLTLVTPFPKETSSRIRVYASFVSAEEARPRGLEPVSVSVSVSVSVVSVVSVVSDVSISDVSISDVSISGFMIMYKGERQKQPNL